MKTATIRSSWMPGYGYRLDCQPYLGGALETKELLEQLAIRRDKLHTLTAGFSGGLYNGPKFSRTWVHSQEYGVPFLGSSVMAYADLSDLPLLSKKLAYGRLLQHLEIRPGMSLISCSGTIGKMVYARDQMAGIWSSQHILKVVPDKTKIPPGYLFAFLSSRFGVPLVVSGTYGSIIQSLGPDQVRDIPVPRIGEKLEREIHNRVEEAARLRTTASRKKQHAIELFISLCELESEDRLYPYESPQLGTAISSQLAERMDSTYYAPACLAARAAFDGAGRRWGSRALGQVAEIFIPTIFKRRYADDPAEGYPYVTGADVFCIRPTSSQYLMRPVALQHRLVLETGMLVLQEAGQRYGLLGRTVMVGSTLNGFACTNNMVRIIPHDSTEIGYIYAVLSSEYGLRLVKREAAGSSIPHLDADRVSSIEIPWPDKQIRRKVSEIALNAREEWDRADDLERQADAMVVDALTKVRN